jgi:hypothetical protein
VRDITWKNWYEKLRILYEIWTGFSWFRTGPIRST